MSFKKNVIFNYCGHFYTVTINIIVIPSYLHYLGAASFGLISIYVVMQSWLSLLNIGFIPALSREVAFYRSQKNGFFQARQLLRSLEIIFLLVNFLVMFGVVFSSHWIAHHWLKVQNLTYSEVMHCIVLMGVITSFRWFSDLYRAGMSGMEEQVWLNSISVVITTLRCGGAYVFLRWVTRMPVHFFEYQLLIAVIESILLSVKCYKIIPLLENFSLGLNVSWGLIKKVFPFAFGLFYTTTLWILLSQSDKLILSHILPLTIYGYFALVTIISGGILQCAMPINLALLPRMTHLLSQGKKEEMLQIYRNATQLVVVILFPLIGIVAMFSTQVIYIWTGDNIAANWAGPILFWYALGTGFMCVSIFQFYLQFAMGNLKLHVISYTVFTLITVPLIFYFAYHEGAKGVAITLFLMQGVLFFIWPPVIHRKYAPGIHSRWLLKDIFPIATVVLIALLCVKKIPIHFELISRGGGFIILSGLVFFVLLAGASASTICRDYFTTFVREKSVSA